MKKNFILTSVLTVTLFLNSSVLKADQLEDLIEGALKNNPRVQAAKSIWRASETRIVSEKSIPQPSGTVMFFGNSIQTKAGPQERRYSLSQKIPFPTKLSLSGKIASEESLIKKANYDLVRMEIIRDLKITYYKLFFVNRTIKIYNEEKNILESIVNSVKSRYETAEVPQQDLVKAELEVENLNEKLLKLSKRKNMFTEKLAEILNTEKKKIEIADEFNLNVKEPKKNKDEFLKDSLAKNPMVIMNRKRASREYYKLSRKKQEYLPDFMLMADYIETGAGTTGLPYDGEDAWMVGGSFTLPLWFWKIESDKKSQKFKYKSALSDIENTENKIKFMIKDLYFKLDTERDLVNLYENIIVPKARQNYTTSKRSYEQQEVEFINWLSAQRSLLNKKVAYLNQLTDYNVTLAKIEYFSGELNISEEKDD